MKQKSLYSLLFLFFPCLLHTAGWDLAAQDKRVCAPVNGYESFHSIEVPVMTEDGNWIAMRKRSWIPVRDKSDLDKDTVILFNLAASDKNKTAAFSLTSGNWHLSGIPTCYSPAESKPNCSTWKNKQVSSIKG